jgi:hypothetical protein
VYGLHVADACLCCPCCLQVGGLFLEELYGQPLFWYYHKEKPPVAYLELCGAPYSQLPDDVRKFLVTSMLHNTMQRPPLSKLLLDPAVREHLGWPEEWGVC